MSFKVKFLSDSMWKRLDATFAYVGYASYDSVHSVPGAHINKMTDLAEQFCRESLDRDKLWYQQFTAWILRFQLHVCI